MSPSKAEAGAGMMVQLQAAATPAPAQAPAILSTHTWNLNPAALVVLQVLAWVIIRSILISLSVSVLKYPLYCCCWLLGVCVGGEHNNRYLEIQQIPSLRGPGPWAELSLERCSSGETERQRVGLLGLGVV